MGSTPQIGLIGQRYRIGRRQTELPERVVSPSLERRLLSGELLVEVERLASLSERE